MSDVINEQTFETLYHKFYDERTKFTQIINGEASGRIIRFYILRYHYENSDDVISSNMKDFFKTNLINDIMNYKAINTAQKKAKKGVKIDWDDIIKTSNDELVPYLNNLNKKLLDINLKTKDVIIIHTSMQNKSFFNGKISYDIRLFYSVVFGLKINSKTYVKYETIPILEDDDEETRKNKSKQNKKLKEEFSNDISKATEFFSADYIRMYFSDEIKTQKELYYYIKYIIDSVNDDNYEDNEIDTIIKELKKYNGIFKIQ
jgi:hypothetical protein